MDCFAASDRARAEAAEERAESLELSFEDTLVHFMFQLRTQEIEEVARGANAISPTLAVLLATAKEDIFGWSIVELALRI